MTSLKISGELSLPIEAVKRGRRKGIGCTLITQRPADLAKQVLTQCEVLVPLRMGHPRDVAAIREWINVHADPDQAKEVIASLPSLPIGMAWVWSPGWLGRLVRIAVRKRTTFDSSATPKVGETPRKPKRLAQIDVQTLGQQIAATVEKAKADDPRELKRRIAELEKQLAQRPKETVEKIVEKEVPVLRNGQLDRTEKIAERLQAFADRFLGETHELQRLISAATIPQAREAAPPRGRAVKAPSARSAPPRRPPNPAPSAEPNVFTPATLPAGEERVLNAIAQYADGVTREMLSVLTGYKRSTRDRYIQLLAQRGFVEAGGVIVATEYGIANLGNRFEPLPTGNRLREYWLARLPEGERHVLESVVAIYPDTIERAAIDEAAGYRRSTRDRYLQLLRARRLVVFVGRGQVQASDLLFD
jgi:hypothetical protein